MDTCKINNVLKSLIDLKNIKENKKENPIPKDTESIIKQAEAAMAEQKK